MVLFSLNPFWWCTFCTNSYACSVSHWNSCHRKLWVHCLYPSSCPANWTVEDRQNAASIGAWACSRLFTCCMKLRQKQATHTAFRREYFQIFSSPIDLALAAEIVFDGEAQISKKDRRPSWLWRQVKVYLNQCSLLPQLRFLVTKVAWVQVPLCSLTFSVLK